MCRFAVRAPPAAGPAQPAAEPLKLESPLDLEALFEQGADDLDANDLALLALFSGATAQPAPAVDQGSSGGSSNGSTAAEASNTVVMGQAVSVALQQALGGPMPIPLPVAAPVPLAAPAPHNPVQQLQFQAVLQHQAAIMQNPQAYPAAAQMYQQALLQQQQQQMLAAQQQAAAAAAAAGLHPAATAAAVGSMAAHPQALVGKRTKTQEEVEEQTERIKKRRRESAQRSRQRKNAYMKSLEMENRALKLENERLRMELTKCAGSSPCAAFASAVPKVSSGSVSRHNTHPESHMSGGDAHDCSVGQGSGHMSMSDDEEDLCDPLMPPHSLHGGAGAHVDGLADDPLTLMPTADLLHFAF